MQVWLFQANDGYELTYELPRRIGDYWHISTNFRNVREGDVAILWQTGQEAGVYAVAEIAGDPAESEKREWQVDIRYRGRLWQPVSKADLLTHPILKGLPVITNAHRANAISVTPEQWDALFALITERSGSKVGAAQYSGQPK